MKRYNKIFVYIAVISIVTAYLTLSAYGAPVANVPEDKYGIPIVNAPNMLLLGTPLSASNDYVQGLYFQSERGARREILTQYQYNPDDPDYLSFLEKHPIIKNADVPLNIQSVLYNNGWYDVGSLDFMNFRSSVSVQNRQYFSIGFALSFEDIPLYQDYTTFEIILYCRNCYWVDDTVDPSAPPSQQLRFDSGDAQFMGMGYYTGNYFTLLSQNTIKRYGDKWLVLQMKVPNDKLSQVECLNLTLNGTVEDDYNKSTVSKQGTLYLDFDFSSLVNVPASYGITTPAYKFTQWGIASPDYFVPSNQYPDNFIDPGELVGEEAQINWANNYGNEVNVYLNSIDVYGRSFWAYTINSILTWPIFTILTVFATYILVSKALLGR